MRDLHEEPIAIPGLAAAPSLEDAAGIERVLDQLWIERGSSKNTLSACRSDLSLFARGLAPRGVEMAHASEADLRDYLAVRGQVHVRAGSDPRLRAPCFCYASAASRRRPARAARQASSARLRPVRGTMETFFPEYSTRRRGTGPLQSPSDLSRCSIRISRCATSSCRLPSSS